MSFFALLILLSLILIVPLIFVLKEKSKQTQNNSTQRHQAYLAAANTPIPTPKITENNTKEDSIHTLDIIAFSAQHPLIQLLYNEHVPTTFQGIIDEIGQQYESTHHEQITESQLFTLNKLIETRIPELVSDYLSLNPEYAKTVIIDSEKAATSYTMVLNQLHSILDFAQKLNNQSQNGVVDKLLASQRYLDEVYKDSGMTDTEDMLTLK